MSAYRLNVPTERGSILSGVLFRNDDVRTDTVMIAITLTRILTRISILP